MKIEEALRVLESEGLKIISEAEQIYDSYVKDLLKSEEFKNRVKKLSAKAQESTGAQEADSSCSSQAGGKLALS